MTLRRSPLQYFGSNFVEPSGHSSHKYAPLFMRESRAVTRGEYELLAKESVKVRHMQRSGLIDMRKIMGLSRIGILLNRAILSDRWN